MKHLTAVFEKSPEGGYACWFEEIPEAVSQGETLKEAQSNLLDALTLILSDRRSEAKVKLKQLRAEKITITTRAIPVAAISLK